MDSKVTKKPAMALKKLSSHIGIVVAIITGLSTIGGAGIAACHWVVDTVNAESNARITQLQEEIEQNNEKQRLATLRLELLALMSYDPNNVVEIEKVGRTYFSEGGDWYLTGLFSKWCTEHECDASIVLLHKEGE